MVPGSEGHQVCIICWCRDGDGARAAYVRMAQLVGEDLQLVRGEAIVVPEHVVVRRSARSLQPHHTAVSIPKTSPNFHLCRGTAAKWPLPQKSQGAVLHISANFSFKRQTTSFLAPHQTNPFLFPLIGLFFRISSLKLNDHTEMHFHLESLRSDKKPSDKVALDPNFNS